MRVAFLVSGNGTLFESLAKRALAGSLPIEVVLLISSNPAAKALDRAHALGISTTVISTSEFGTESEFAAALTEALHAAKADAVCLAGYLKKVPNAVVAAYRNRMLNIHPALLPAFGGAGMYGRRVHEAVIQSGARISGATIHLVDEEYDRGPIVMQRAIFVSPEDTAETLESRVHVIEFDLYFEALKLLAENRLQVKAGRVYILPKTLQ